MWFFSENSTKSDRNSTTEKSEKICGLDHRVGHFRPLRIMGVTPNVHVLNGLEASTWDRSSWGGRRRDQGRLISLNLMDGGAGRSKSLGSLFSNSESVFSNWVSWSFKGENSDSHIV